MKILLNSLYGALLNEGLRFYDERLGQSVTLTGRSIVRHMNAKINEIIAGTYDYTGEAITYADTDSCYFSAYHVLKDNPEYADFDWSRESIIKLYDDIADLVNESFPDFMAETFNTSLDRGAIIKAGRELVASKGLFIKKKKYAVLMYDKDGDRLDTPIPNSNKPNPGKMKAMGLDLKRADTPKYMQEFLQDMLMNLLTDIDKDEIMVDIKDFRLSFKDKPAWEKGSPKKVSGLSEYGSRVARRSSGDIMTAPTGKVNMPGHVRASLNWNRLCEAHHDLHVQRITDGTRIVVCKLRPNPTGMESVAFPIDEPHLPEWFKALPFDHEAMEEAIIDSKILNLVEVLDWDLEQSKDRPCDEFFFMPK